MDASKKHIVLFGFLLVGISWMSVKLSAPVLPVLESKFHTDPIYIKLAGTIYLITFSIAQVLYGAISRYHHRRHLIFGSVCVAFLGTFIAMISTSIVYFVIGRILEALGVGGGSTLCRVMMADRLEKQEIAQVTILFGIIYSLNPFISPSIGQYIIIFAGWRWVFAFFLCVLAAYGITTYFKLEETKPTIDEKFSFSHLTHDYKQVLSNPVFWSYIVGFGLFSGLMIGYYMAIPFWFYVHFGISEKVYTFLAIFTAVPNILAYYFGRFFIKKHGTTGTLRIAYAFGSVGFLASLIMLFFEPSVASYIIPLMFIATATGLIQPATNAGLIHQFREYAGIIGAAIPLFGVGIGGILFLILTNINLDAIWPFCVILFVIVGFGFLNRVFLKKHASHL